VPGWTHERIAVVSNRKQERLIMTDDRACVSCRYTSSMLKRKRHRHKSPEITFSHRHTEALHNGCKMEICEGHQKIEISE